MLESTSGDQDDLESFRLSRLVINGTCNMFETVKLHFKSNKRVKSEYETSSLK